MLSIVLLVVLIKSKARKAQLMVEQRLSLLVHLARSSTALIG